MAPLRVVLDAQNFSDDALVRVVRQLLKQARYLEVLRLEPDRLEMLRARIGSRLSQRIRPPRSARVDTVFVPAPYNFATGALTRLQHRRGKVVRIYLPGCSPALAVTRWVRHELPADGEYPDYTRDYTDVDDGRHRVWVRGDEIGIGAFTSNYTSAASLLDGVSLAVRRVFSRWVRPIAGRIRRSITRRH